MTTHNLLAVSSYGAIEGDVQTLLMALRGLATESFHFDVASKPRGDVYERLRQIPQIDVLPLEMGGIEALSPGRRGKYYQAVDFASALVKLVSTIRAHHIDAIYSIDRGVAPQLAAFASRITGCPYILNAAYPFYPQNGWVAKFVLRQATRIQAHSRYLVSHLAPCVNDDNRFAVIPNGLEIEKYDLNLDGKSVREAYNVAPHEPIVAMMGRLNHYKGQDDLIKSSVAVLEKHPDAHFLISGRGPDEVGQRLQQLITSLHVGQRVRLVGYVPSTPEFLAASNIVAMPSWEEPFGLVALEGMAMSKPVVSTLAGGVPEFVLNQQAGLLIPPRSPVKLAEAIIQLLDNPVMAQQMGMEGRRQVESKYTSQHYVAQVANMISDVLRAKKR